MIVILGSNHDDILYFESVMTNKKELQVMNRFPAIKGTIFNQEAILVYDVYSNYVSSAVTAYLIEKYFVLLVFNVGKCISFTDDLKNGEIVVSKKTYLGNVDLTEGNDTRLGQIPGFDFNFETQLDVLESLDQSLENRTLITSKRATFISTNKEYVKYDQLNDIRVDKTIFGESSNIALDTTLGGVAVSCTIHNIPFVGVKVVYRNIEQKSTANGYAKVLKSYTGLGKAIISCIGDIGRSEVVKEDDVYGA